MEYREIEKDLFELDPNKYKFAHCISADFAMGAGIAPQFQKHFGTKTQLLKFYSDFLGENTYLNGWRNRIKQGRHGDCLYIAPVFNLITKEFCYDKPTYQSVRESLESLRAYCIHLNIDKLAMPKIACGIDGLSWDKVSSMIKEVFKDVDIEITICFLNNLSKS